VDWPNQTIAYARQKTGSLAMIHFGEDIEAILRRLPVVGPLFPYLQSVRAGDRATEFKQRCEGLGIKGVSLHSYRYAWAERAKQCGYPERFAREALGQNSKAVHRAYARKARVKLPSLESYDRRATDGRIIQLPSRSSENRPGRIGRSVEPVVSICSTLATPVAGVSFSPVLTDSVTGAAEPFLIAPKLIECLGGEKLRAVAGRMTERFQEAGCNKNGNLVRLEVEIPSGLSRIQTGGGNFPTEEIGSF
jgi:hypothetical protein